MRNSLKSLVRFSHPRRLPSGERGQSLVEFSVIGVFLTVLLMGVADLGRAYFTYLALKDAAAEGAYFGAVYPACTSASDPECASPNNVEYRIKNSAPQGSLVDWSTVGIDLEATTLTPGDSLTVTVTYQYPLITPLVGTIVGSQNLTLKAESVAVILSEAMP